MIERLRRYWMIIGTRLWFIPLLMSIAAVALAITVLSFGTAIPSGVKEFWIFYSGDASNARDLLSSLMTGMITMTSLVVSITMVVLTLAAGQLGPRLIRNFIGDRETQTVLGLFIATILYILVVLRTIEDELGGDEVPHVAITGGTFLSALCLFVLLFYVNKLARSIMSDTVVGSVARDLRRTIDRLLPVEEHRAEPVAAPSDPGVRLALNRDGYVEAIDLDALVKAARKADAVIRLSVRPGHYVLARGDHVTVHPAEACSDELADRVRAAFLIGTERTPAQDIEFGIRQLVEIAVRALSPGINDPFTAIAVIDALSATVARVFERSMEEPVRRDKDGCVRVVRNIADYEGIIGAAFDQIRQASSGMPDVQIRLIDALSRLAPYIREEAQIGPIVEQLDMILVDAEDTIKAPRDIAAVRERHRSARAEVIRCFAAARRDLVTG